VQKEEEEEEEEEDKAFFGRRGGGEPLHGHGRVDRAAPRETEAESAK
jgi:hypothetical protein